MLEQWRKYFKGSNKQFKMFVFEMGLIFTFFIIVGQSLMWCFFAIPLLVYSFIFNSKFYNPNLLVKYSYRVIAVIYFLTVAIYLMSMKFNLKTTYFYEEMSGIERLFTSIMISVILSLVFMIFTLLWEKLYVKFNELYEKND